ncbi:cupin domain-containing protein [Nocardia altamirensis]|uniref:cupin domain-containing protein n=1 Tax=Nocardia altamirensis TaxID=472158 RepID=UPI00084064A9|nr:cupin domain-containing protein [Nocardia altamirensis]
MPERRHELGQYQPIAEWAFGCLVIWHQLAETTGGVLSTAEVVVPRGAEPPVHVHSREDEMCFVLEGELTVHRGLDRVAARPGTSVWLPRGIPHGFAVRTATARVLHHYTPAGIEKAHRAFGTAATGTVLPPADVRRPSDAEVEAEFARYGVTLVGPSPANGPAGRS